MHATASNTAYHGNGPVRNYRVRSPCDKANVTSQGSVIGVQGFEFKSFRLIAEDVGFSGRLPSRQGHVLNGRQWHPLNEPRCRIANCSPADND